MTYQSEKSPAAYWGPLVGGLAGLAIGAYLGVYQYEKNVGLWSSMQTQLLGGSDGFSHGADFVQILAGGCFFGALIGRSLEERLTSMWNRNQG